MSVARVDCRRLCFVLLFVHTCVSTFLSTSLSRFVSAATSARVSELRDIWDIAESLPPPKVSGTSFSRPSAGTTHPCILSSSRPSAGALLFVGGGRDGATVACSHGLGGGGGDCPPSWKPLFVAPVLPPSLAASALPPSVVLAAPARRSPFPASPKA